MCLVVRLAFVYKQIVVHLGCECSCESNCVIDDETRFCNWLCIWL